VGDAEPGADLGPGVAAAAQPLDRPGYRGVDLVGEIGYEDQGFDVAIASATRPQGAPLTGLPWRATQSEADEAPRCLSVPGDDVDQMLITKQQRGPSPLELGGGIETPQSRVTESHFKERQAPLTVERVPPHPSAGQPRTSAEPVPGVQSGAGHALLYLDTEQVKLGTAASGRVLFGVEQPDP